MLGVAVLIAVAIAKSHPSKVESAPGPAANDHAAAVRYFAEASRLAEAKEVALALKAAEKAKQNDPTWLPPYKLRTDLLAACAHLREAREEILAAHRIAPDNPDVTLSLLGVSKLTSPAENEALSRQVIAQAPDNWAGYYQLGLAIAASGQSGRYPEASHAFEDALRRFPYGVAAMIQLGQMQSLMGQNEKAAQTLAQARALLDKEHEAGQMPFSVLKEWVEQMQAVSFWQGQVYRRLGRETERRKAMALAGEYSAQTAELRALQDRANSTPPDREARARLDTIAATGRVR